MKRPLNNVLVALAATVALGGGQLFAQNLLLNADLEEPLRIPGETPTPTDWTLDEGPDSLGPVVGDYNKNGKVDGADYVVWRKRLGQSFQLPNEGTTTTPGMVTAEDYDAWRADFGMVGAVTPTNTAGLFSINENPNHSGENGLWFMPWRGSRPNVQGAPPATVFAHLKQSVAGTPGMTYTMTGWARFDQNYAGGHDFLDGDGVTNPLDPIRASDMLGGPSPTDTFFALEFLDASGNVLAGSVVIELKENGQPNDDHLPNHTLADEMWMQHTLTAMAPANTVSVQVRASMVDGIWNTDPRQSAFVDDFSLTATAGSGASLDGVPEPTTWVLVAVSLLLVGESRRSR